jgi:hypothetical protein
MQRSTIIVILGGVLFLVLGIGIGRRFPLKDALHTCTVSAVTIPDSVLATWDQCGGQPGKTTTPNTPMITMPLPPDKPRPVFGTFHHRTTVARWYYDEHPHPFDCRDISPSHEDYGCKECPVGPADRVVHYDHGHYTDDFAEANVYEACNDINILIPEPSSEVDDDQFYCQREPMDGYVEMYGQKISCAR